jgi:hypothetical protein
VGLDIGPPTGSAMLGIVHAQASNYFTWRINGGDARIRRKCVDPHGDEHHKMDHKNILHTVLEWDFTEHTTSSFLQKSDSPLDITHVLAGSSGVDETIFKCITQRFKFHIHQNTTNTVASAAVNINNLF